jgi:hypothetical protein
MNVKLKIALLALLLIAIILIASLLLFNQNIGNETKIQVSDFKWTGWWGSAVGVTAMRGFNVTVQNLGTNDVENLTLEVKMIANGTALQNTGIILSAKGVNDSAEVLDSFGLRGGQVCTLKGVFLTTWWSWGGVTTIVVDVRLADVVVGELKIDYY